MSFSVVYVTHENESAGRKLAEQMVQERLIACFNLFPMQSGYWWRGEVAQEGEWVTIMKTTNACWPDLMDRLSLLHPYEIPCIVRWQAEANPAYEQWIEEEVKK